jgi:hypothetical protein
MVQDDLEKTLKKLDEAEKSLSRANSRKMMMIIRYLAGTLKANNAN